MLLKYYDLGTFRHKTSQISDILLFNIVEALTTLPTSLTRYSVKLK